MTNDVAYQLAHREETRVPSLILSGAICLAAAYMAVVLRLISRRLVRSPLAADDWCMVLGLVFTSAFTINILVLIRFGLGRHAIFIKQPSTFAKIVVANEIMYNPAVVAIKSSILLLYRRLFPGKRFHVVLWCVGGFILAYSFAQSAAEMFQCSPINAAWNQQVNGDCIKLADELLASSILNVLTDCLLLVLPLPILWQLQISMERKLQLIGIFSLGGFVCIVSIIRTPTVRAVSLHDASWADVDGIIWSMVELNVGIVNGCLPTLRPLFNARLRPSRGQVRLPENKDATYITPRVKLQSITRSLNPENYRELGATGYDAGSMHD